MARNGSLLAGGHQVKITPQEAKLSLDEVFRHAEDELRCQEKSDTFGRIWSGRGPVQNYEARREFDVSGVSEIKIQDTKAPTSGLAARPSPEASSTHPQILILAMSTKPPETRNRSSVRERGPGHPAQLRMDETTSNHHAASKERVRGPRINRAVRPERRQRPGVRECRRTTLLL